MLEEEVKSIDDLLCLESTFFGCRCVIPTPVAAHCVYFWMGAQPGLRRLCRAMRQALRLPGGLPCPGWTRQTRGLPLRGRFLVPAITFPSALIHLASRRTEPGSALAGQLRRDSVYPEYSLLR